MNEEKLVLEELQRIVDSLDAFGARLEKIENNINRILAWIEKVVELSQNRFENTEGS